jgi:hypothetical protein
MRGILDLEVMLELKPVETRDDIPDFVVNHYCFAQIPSNALMFPASFADKRYWGGPRSRQ